MGVPPKSAGYTPKPGGFKSKGSDSWPAQDLKPSLDTTGIDLSPAAGKALNPDLFDGIARRVAQAIATAAPYANKPAQIRQFYDELVMWEERARQNPDRFADYLPFIRMLNAKAAYAEGRKHVDKTFVALMAHGLRQVENPATLRNFNSFSKPFWDKKVMSPSCASCMDIIRLMITFPSPFKTPPVFSAISFNVIIFSVQIFF